jgi:hypothetical protein
MIEQIEYTLRKIKPREYKGFKIGFCEEKIDGSLVVWAQYRTFRLKSPYRAAKGKDEDIAFNRIKKIIDKKEKGPIPKFKPYCWGCQKTLTVENLYPYTNTISMGEMKFYCKECTRTDMMLTKTQFLKEIENSEKITFPKAVFENDGNIVWKEK